MSQLFASVDLGGTNIKCAFGDERGRIVSSRTTPTRSHEGPSAVLARIARLIDDLAREVGSRPRAAAMGVPGLVDVARGICRWVPNLPTQWRDVPIRELLEPEIGCSVYILNDVRMATLGELVFGHGRGEEITMAFFSLGTGVGGGVAIDGHLRLGSLGAAGELGHQTVLPEGPLCGCGNRGCLETLASGPALTAAGVRLLLSGLAPGLHSVTAGDLSKVSPRTMIEAIDTGDEAVKAEVVRAFEFLGIGVSNVIANLHPDIVVLGGGVSRMGTLLLETVRETVDRRVRMFPADTVRIVLSRLAEEAGTLGGIALAARNGEI